MNRTLSWYNSYFLKKTVPQDPCESLCDIVTECDIARCAIRNFPRCLAKFVIIFSQFSLVLELSMCSVDKLVLFPFIIHIHSHVSSRWNVSNIQHCSMTIDLPLVTTIYFYPVDVCKIWFDQMASTSSSSSSSRLKHSKVIFNHSRHLMVCATKLSISSATTATACVFLHRFCR